MFLRLYTYVFVSLRGLGFHFLTALNFQVVFASTAIAMAALARRCRRRESNPGSMEMPASWLSNLTPIKGVWPAP